MKVDIKTLLNSSSAFHFVIFKKDNILAFFEDGNLYAATTELTYGSGGAYSGRLSIEIGPGDYTLAIFGVGDVGDGYLAAKELYILSTKLTERVELAELTSKNGFEIFCHVFDGVGDLSKGQCQELISFINLECKYWLDNATSDVKKTLGINSH